MADNQPDGRLIPVEFKPQMPDTLLQFASDLREYFHRYDGRCPDVAPHGELPFEELAMRLFALQHAANPAYRTECDGLGITPDAVRDWRSIPAMPAAAFKVLDLSSVPSSMRTRVFRSSGTTGHTASRHVHSADSLALYESSLWPWFRRHLLPMPGAGLPTIGAGPGRILSLTPPGRDVPGSSLVHMIETVMERAGSADGWTCPAFLGTLDSAGGWILRVDAVLQSLTAAVDGGHPVMLLGTAFNFVHLIEACDAAGCRVTLPAGSRLMETGGYKGRSRAVSRTELLSDLTRILGIPSEGMVGEYGMSELSSQAYDAVAGVGGARVFRFPPWARARIVSVETGRDVEEGETGLLRIVDLANVWSVMAIQTEDLAVRCGTGFQLAGRAPAAEARGCSLRSAGEN